MIQVFHSVAAARTALGSCAITIGKYDGMHLGHQKILQELKVEALRLDVPTLVILSEPQPEEFFAGPAAPARLNAFHDKVRFLDQFGIDAVYCLGFDRETSAQLPDVFVSEVLQQGLGMRSIVVGDDFRFGYNRSGDISTLQRLAAAGNFTVKPVAPCVESGERISSTLIRRYLQQGDCEHANACLGRAYSISGKVIEGRKLGRQLGFPTANLQLANNKLPLMGIFVVEVLHGGTTYQGVASVGYNPTVSDASQASLEVYLLDFVGDLYGSILTASFLHKLRDEAKFASLELLQQQIAADVKDARTYFGVSSK
ncbi:MAG: bifunctional riboflavin kinase/FAD synthetase [Pseudomonadota bacterium]